MAHTLINDKVLGDVIGAELPNALKFAPVAVVGTTLQNVAGDTIKVEKYAYIGEAQDVKEGQPIPLADLVMSEKDVTVKKKGQGVPLTDEQVIRRGEEVVNEAKNQIKMSIADGMDSDCYTSLKISALKYDNKKNILNYEAIVRATALFGEKSEMTKVLYINPLQKAELQLDPMFTRATAMGDKVVSTGVIGEIAGCQVIVSGKVKEYTASSTKYYDNPIVIVGGLGIEMAKSTVIGVDRSNKTSTSEYYGTEHFVTYIKDDTKVINVTSLSTKPVA
ncbi:N4-gp56 family major capsid protein [Clostridium botulinum]|uniref:N4-gp56 family major capsid protein n=1 Tax=Clostridium botulinum TaxID=1491 RepID=UPI001C9AFF8F|nr:N4-gp56 family major capsid protein [Clostridium botulinum]MBY6816463.1 N4-gp56 family major capsid protein [Clostridium botulinum]MBY6827282.1 N4-gp56 family major capsid protein [Clostridium botulinum]MBY6859230.1 N4-gp56 family major capsid protein [Clostridium botulinum]MBY7041486.1 N4-gp56 family major capsid protein [Clostridium botulinum]